MLFSLSETATNFAYTDPTQRAAHGPGWGGEGLLGTMTVEDEFK